MRIARSMDGLIENWQAWKRDAALLDFDDLLYTARDLVREHETVRQALTGRFRHVLVDEFQDTDPLQIDLLWRLCGKSAGEPTLLLSNELYGRARCFSLAIPNRRSSVSAAPM